MPKEPETLRYSEVRHMRRGFQVMLSEKEKAFLIKAAKEDFLHEVAAQSDDPPERWALATFIRNAAIAAAEEILKADFKE